MMAVPTLARIPLRVPLPKKDLSIDSDTSSESKKRFLPKSLFGLICTLLLVRERVSSASIEEAGDSRREGGREVVGWLQFEVGLSLVHQVMGLAESESLLPSVDDVYEKVIFEADQVMRMDCLASDDVWHAQGALFALLFPSSPPSILFYSDVGIARVFPPFAGSFPLDPEVGRLGGGSGLQNGDVRRQTSTDEMDSPMGTKSLEAWSPDLDDELAHHVMDGSHRAGPPVHWPLLLVSSFLPFVA